MEIDLLNVKYSMWSVQMREMQYGQTTHSRQLLFKLQHSYCLQKEMWRIRKEMKQKQTEIKTLWKVVFGNTVYKYVFSNFI